MNIGHGNGESLSSNPQPKIITKNIPIIPKSWAIRYRHTITVIAVFTRLFFAMDSNFDDCRAGLDGGGTGRICLFSMYLIIRQAHKPNASRDTARPGPTKRPAHLTVEYGPSMGIYQQSKYLYAPLVLIAQLIVIDVN